jgi:hypothetical protein
VAVTWTVDTKAGEVHLDCPELLMQLLQKGMQSERPAHEELIRALTDYLQGQGALASCNPQQLALIAFDAGYFYRVFLEKNNVKVETEHVEERNENRGDLPARSPGT